MFSTGGASYHFRDERIYVWIHCERIESGYRFDARMTLYLADAFAPPLLRELGTGDLERLAVNLRHRNEDMKRRADELMSARCKEMAIERSIAELLTGQRSRASSLETVHEMCCS
jgi:hypothetical protein